MSSGKASTRRIARQGRKRQRTHARTHARTLIATHKGSRWFFVCGFEKNERARVSVKELEALQANATDLVKLTAAQLDTYVAGDAVQEICHD